MLDKIGRNEPCWCGSKKKYKKCHLDRHKQPRPKLHELNNELKKRSSKKYCSCPSDLKHKCSGRIVNAHTVSKSSSLKKISVNSHVYGFKFDLLKLDKSEGALEPELIGINKASTFTGFCSFHDRELFSSFENHPFSIDKKQIFLIGYRSVAREYYAKMCQYNSLEDVANIDKGLDIASQITAQLFVNDYRKGLNLGVADANCCKNLYDNKLVNEEYESISYCVLEIDGIFPIQCSGSMYPEKDFQKQTLQYFGNSKKRLDAICFSIVAEDEKSYVIFSWLPEHGATCEKFIDSFLKLSEEKKINAIFAFAFSTFENTYMNPAWFDKLPQDKKLYIIKMISSFFNLSKVLNFDVDFGRFNVVNQFRN